MIDIGRTNTETVRKIVKLLCKRKGIENKRKLLPSFVKSFSVWISQLALGLKIQSYLKKEQLLAIVN